MATVRQRFEFVTVLEIGIAPNATVDDVRKRLPRNSFLLLLRRRLERYGDALGVGIAVSDRLFQLFQGAWRLFELLDERPDGLLAELV